MTETEQKPTPKPPAIRSGGSVMAFIPEDLDQIWRMARMAVVGGMAPKSLVDGKDPDAATSACAISIMAGAELGLTPLMSLRSYAVVNGRPSLWGDGLIAVVRKSGIAEFVRSGADATKGWCESKRKDTGEEMRREFTLDQAKKAGLTNKKGPWQEYPDMMMERRAIALCLTRLYADVLGGLANADDAVDDGPMLDITPPRAEPPPVPPAPPPVPPVEDVEQGASDAPETAETAPSANDEAKRRYLERLREELDDLDDAESVEQRFDDLSPQQTLADDEAALAEAFKVKAARLAEIEQEGDGQQSMFPGDDIPAESMQMVKNMGAG